MTSLGMVMNVNSCHVFSLHRNCWDCRVFRLVKLEPVAAFCFNMMGATVQGVAMFQFEVLYTHECG